MASPTKMVKFEHLRERGNIRIDHLFKAYQRAEDRMELDKGLGAALVRVGFVSDTKTRRRKYEVFVKVSRVSPGMLKEKEAQRAGT